MSDSPAIFHNDVTGEDEFLLEPSWAACSSLSAFPSTGVAGVLYLARDTNSLYRWTGSSYVRIGGGESGGIDSLYPPGSCYYADGGTAANPARYIVKDQSGTVIGYVNLSWDGSPLVLVGTEATDASGTALTHGTYALYYDGSGNLTSAVCTN